MLAQARTSSRPDHGEQQRQHQPRVGAGEGVASGADADGPIAIGVGIFAGQALRRSPPPARCASAIVGAVGQRPTGRHCALGCGWPAPGRRRSGTHRSISDWLPSSMSGASTPTIVCGSPLTSTSRPRTASRAAIARGPEPVAERDDPRGAGPFVGARQQPSAEPRRSPHKCLQVADHLLAQHALRECRRCAASPGCAATRPAAQKARDLVTIGGVVGQRHAAAVGQRRRAGSQNPAEPLRPIEGQRLDHQHVGDAEDDRVGADGQGQGDHRGPGVAGLGDEQPQAVDEVVPECASANLLGGRWTARARRGEVPGRGDGPPPVGERGRAAAMRADSAANNSSRSPSDGVGAGGWRPTRSTRARARRGGRHHVPSTSSRPSVIRASRGSDGAQRPQARRGDPVDALGAPAALGGRLAEVAADQRLGLEPVEGLVDGGQRRRSRAGAALDLAPHRHAVGVVAAVQHAQHHQLLELAEGRRVAHARC